MTDYSGMTREELEQYTAELEEENQILKQAIEDVNQHLKQNRDDLDEMTRKIEQAIEQAEEVELYEPEFDDVIQDIEDLVDENTKQ